MLKRRLICMRVPLVLLLIVGALVSSVTLAAGAPDEDVLAPEAGAPTVVSYQGRVFSNGVPYEGNGKFKFAIVNAAGTTSYWSNDGTSAGGAAPTAGVTLAVSNGLFTVLLGDTSLTGMTHALSASVFSGTDRYLRVWFSSGGSYTRLTPDTRISAVPYALQAQQAASVPGAPPYAYMVVVAKQGGNYTSIQAAVNSISGATASKPYLVWVAPGIYKEPVSLKPYVHLQGAGEDVTIITTNDATKPTLRVVDNSSVRDLTLEHIGTGDSVALACTTGTSTVTRVTARAEGTGANNIAIELSGADTVVTLSSVDASAEHGTVRNTGLGIEGPAAGILYEGNYSGKGSPHAEGIWVHDGGGLAAQDTRAAASGATITTAAVRNDGSTVGLRDGAYLAYGGEAAVGIFNSGASANLTTEGAIARGYGDGPATTNDSMGLANVGGDAQVRGGEFTSSAATNSYGVFNNGGDLDLDGARVVASSGAATNYGVMTTGATGSAKVRNCEITGTPAVRLQQGACYVAMSLLGGGASHAVGPAFHCYGNYGAGYTGYVCP